MSIQGISGTMNHIKQVQRLTYVMNTAGTEVILYVNKSQYAGRYASINDAQLAAQGLLTKCGCSKPDERILNVPQEIISPGLRTHLTLPNWADVAVEYDQLTPAFGYFSASQRMSLNGNAIVLQLSGTSKDVSLYVKRSFSPITATTASPISEGYTRVNLFPAYLIVSHNEYVRFKCDHNYQVPYPTVASALELVTVTNLSNNGSAVDTFNMNYSILI